MGLLDMFKKKKPLPKMDFKSHGSTDLGLKKSHDMGMPKPRFEEPAEPRRDFNLPRATQPVQPQNNQLLIEKLDKVSHKLDLMDKRLEIIEKIAKESQE